MKTELWSILLVLIGTIIGAFGALYIKIGSKDFSLNIKKIIKNQKLILGFVFYALSSVFYVIALKGGDLSVIYPIVSIGYAWVCILSVWFLKEKMNSWKWIGIATIILGITLVGIGG
ncbi:MAG: SMR family transporter [Candidatus Nanoarchaeia archaeon]|nr:SMR family transporter [Candidatus Nanoarchaeia archaeon]